GGMRGMGGQERAQRGDAILIGGEERPARLKVNGGRETIPRGNVEQRAEIAFSLVVLGLGAVPALHKAVDTGGARLANVSLNGSGISRRISGGGLKRCFARPERSR